MVNYIREAKTPKMLGATSRRFLQPTRSHTSFNSVKSWIIFRKGICWSPTTPWRSRSYETPLDQSTSTLTMTKWSIYIPWWFSITIWHDQIGHSCKGESSLLFRHLVDTVGQRKLRPIKELCARRTNALLLVRRGKRIRPRKQRPIRMRPTWSADPRT